MTCNNNANQRLLPCWIILRIIFLTNLKSSTVVMADNITYVIGSDLLSNNLDGLFL